MGYNAPRILSRPFGIEWAGWRSDTYRLQQSGWELSVEMNIGYRHEYGLIMRHQSMRLYAVSDVLEIENFERITSIRANPEDMPVFHVRQVAPQIHICQMTTSTPMAYQPIDAKPCFVEHKYKSVEDLNIFNVPMTRTEEILINKADMTVIEHLEEIKRLQSDKQKEIRQRIVTGDNQAYECKPRMHMVAQLVHYAEAA